MLRVNEIGENASVNYFIFVSMFSNFAGKGIVGKDGKFIFGSEGKAGSLGLVGMYFEIEGREGNLRFLIFSIRIKYSINLVIKL